MRLFISTLICVFLFLYCGSNKELKKPQETDKKKITSCADYANKEGYQLQNALIIDFANVSNNREYKSLSTQIADRLYRDLNRCFIILNPSYVRKYIKEQNISDEQLYDRETALKIAQHFEVDIFIYGSFNITGKKIQIIGEIASVESKKGFYDLTLTGDKDNILEQLNDLSKKATDIAIANFPPSKKSDKQIIKKATKKSELIKIVDIYHKGEEISKKFTPMPDDQTAEEKPSPRPEWTWKHPIPDEYIYFVGQAMEQKDFNTGLENAVKDVYLSMSRAVGKQIESVYSKRTYRGKSGDYEEITGKLIITTLNYVRGEQLAEKYWRKLKNGTYEICVLYKISKSQLERNIAESIEAEKERLKTATALAIAKRQEAEAEKYKAQAELIRQLESNRYRLIDINETTPKYSYTKPKKQDKKDKLEKNEKNEIVKGEGQQEDMVLIKGGTFWMGCHEANQIVEKEDEDISFLNINNLEHEKNKFNKSLYILIPIMLFIFLLVFFSYRKRKRILFVFLMLCQFNLLLLSFVMCGGFNSGSKAEKKDSKTKYMVCKEDSKPAHKVTIDDFWMDQNLVTTEEFESFIKTDEPSKKEYTIARENLGCNIGATFARENRPVNCVSWFVAKEYCESKGKRLPTEAEWEYAAGNGSKHTVWSLGNTFERKDYCVKWSLCPIGSYEHNEYGLYDMVGNAKEWVEDWYQKYYYKRSNNKNPLCIEESDYKVSRGGFRGNMTINNRYKERPDEDNSVDTGFRCAMDV